MTSLKVLRPVRLKLCGKTRTWGPGEVLTLDSEQVEAVKTSPLADSFRLMAPAEIEEHNAKARETLDRFFAGAVVLALSQLHKAGRLPVDGLSSPEWRAAEEEWVKASEDSPLPCNAGEVKRLMARFIEARGGTVPEAPARKDEPVRAVTIRHKRTGQEVIVLSTVLDSWLADGWEQIEPGAAHKDAPGSTIMTRPKAGGHEAKQEGRR